MIQNSLIAAALALAGAAPAAAQSTAAPTAGWQNAGRLGLVQYIVVDATKARDRAFYDRIVDAACTERPTCFLRFFTNTTGAPVAVPLPDAIAAEATAIFQRSDKRGGADFRWSCRMQQSDGVCF